MADNGTVSEQSGVPKQTALAIIGGVIALVVVIALVAGGGDDATDLGFDARPVSDEPTVTEPADTADVTATDSGYDSGLAPIDCRSLLANDAAAIALEQDDPDGEIINTLTFAQGERCAYQNADDDRQYVIVEPSTPDAIGDDAPGEPIEGLGAVARWVVDDDAGVLHVAEASEFGTVLLRVEFAHPERTDEIRRTRAIELARRVLLRMPGIDWTVEPPEPVEPTRIEGRREPETGPTSVDLLDNLVALVEDGSLDERDAYVATLAYLVGDTDGADILPSERTVDPTADRVVEAARAFATTAPPEDAAAIDALLERLAPTDLPPIRPARTDPEPAAGASRVLPPPAQEDAEPSDDDATETDDPAEPSVCETGPDWFGLSCFTDYPIRIEDTPALDDKYVVSGPDVTDGPVGGVDVELIDQLSNAIVGAGLPLEPDGPLPRLRFVLNPESAATEFLSGGLADGTCLVHAYVPTIRARSEAEIRQWVAFEVAGCLLRLRIPGRDLPTFVGDAWVLPAYMYYLSSVVVPDGGVEERLLPGFSAAEVDEPLHRRSRANAFFFLHLHETGGVDGVLDLIRSIPSEGTSLEGQGSALAGLDGFGATFHGFARAVTDRAIPDSIGGTYDHSVVAFAAQAVEGDAIIEDTVPLTVQRWRVFVPAGMRACTSFEGTGDLRFSWRLLDEDDGALDWRTDPPSELDGNTVLVATTTRPDQSFSLVFDRIVEQTASCDDEDDDGFEPDPIDPEPCPEICAPSGYFGEPEILGLVGG